MRTLDEYRNIVIKIFYENRDFIEKYIELVKSKNLIDSYLKLEKEFKLYDVSVVYTIEKLINLANKKIDKIQELLNKYENEPKMIKIIVNSSLIQNEIDDLYKIDEYIDYLMNGNDVYNLIVEIAKNDKYNKNVDIITFLEKNYYVNILKGIVDDI